MILLLHNRYRHTGGEERAVADLKRLIETHLDERAEILERDSAIVGARQAASGLLRGGLKPQEIHDAVKRTQARIVHAHNLHPTLGWRALKAAKQAGARTVFHAHNYRLTCSIGTCFTHGEDCTRCHGRNTLPGVRLNCRGASRAEAVAYAIGIAAQQRNLAKHADAFIVPSAFAAQRLTELGAPTHDTHVIASAQHNIATRSSADHGEFILAAGRLAPEKGFADAIEACRRANKPLVIAGDGPERPELERQAKDHDVRFTGRLAPDELDALRARAALAIVPSRYEEIFPLAAAESMAAGLPTVAASRGGLREFVPAEGQYTTIEEAAQRIDSLYASKAAGERALARAREVTAPQHIAAQLKALYDALS